MAIGRGNAFLFLAALGGVTGATVATAHDAWNDADGKVAVVRVQVGKDKAEIKRLASEGYDVAGVDVKRGTVDIVAHDANEAASLKMRGFKVEAVSQVDTTLAPDQNYKTPAEIETILRQYANDYPGITRLESIGKSGEGRDIWALKITDNPGERELDEPAIFFNGMHHAREVMTPEVVLDTVEQLLTKYGTDATTTRWVDGNEIWVVPMLNPDGNNKVWTSNSMWRKNTRGGYGVDINRNYPYLWNSCGGSSGSTGADDYRGPSAGSEPETQAMMAFVRRIQPVFSISYHSYSELVIYPYGCNGSRVETRDVVEPIGNAMAQALPSDSGSGKYDPGTAWELLYDVDGGDIDWLYHDQHVIPFVIEVNTGTQGFQPAYRYRDPTVQKLRAAWTMLFQRMEGSGVRGVVRDQSDQPLSGASVTVKKLGREGDLAPTPYTWAIKSDGTYHVILNPGMYELTFMLMGRTVTKNVTIGAERVEMDVQL
jgi:hypothetical protein